MHLPQAAVVPGAGVDHGFRCACRKHADVVVASIYVNPTQFSANEDFDVYPRDPVSGPCLLGAAGKNRPGTCSCTESRICAVSDHRTAYCCVVCDRTTTGYSCSRQGVQPCLSRRAACITKVSLQLNRAQRPHVRPPCCFAQSTSTAPSALAAAEACTAWHDCQKLDMCVRTQGKSKHELATHTHSQTLGVGYVSLCCARAVCAVAAWTLQWLVLQMTLATWWGERWHTQTRTRHG
jgi:hypothetical protein